MHTEDEVRKLWCPWARQSYEGYGSFNRDNKNSSDKGCFCIASDCAAWQFIDTEHRRETELWSKSKNKRVNSAWSDDADWRPVGSDAGKEPPKAFGFCGIARREEP